METNVAVRAVDHRPVDAVRIDVVIPYFQPGSGLLPAAGHPKLLHWRGSVPVLMGAGHFESSTPVSRRLFDLRLRFSTQFRRAGEDRLAFWQLLMRATVVMFTPAATVMIGYDGVGTWSHANFGSIVNLIRLADEIRLRRLLLGRFPATAANRRTMEHAIALRCYLALHSALHLVRRYPGVFKEILKLFQADPLCAPAWCVSLPKMLLRKIRGQPIMTEWLR